MANQVFYLVLITSGLSSLLGTFGATSDTKRDKQEYHTSDSQEDKQEHYRLNPYKTEDDKQEHYRLNPYKTEDDNVVDTLPDYYRNNFDCSKHQYAFGMYADMDFQCQVYHICHHNRKETFLCPKGTLFNQRLLVCDHWYSVKCAETPTYYYVNEDFGKPSNRTGYQDYSRRRFQPGSRPHSPTQTSWHRQTESGFPGQQFPAGRDSVQSQYHPSTGSEGTRYGSHDTSEGTRYGSQDTSQGTRYGTTGTRYGSQDTSQGTRYGSQDTSTGTRYGSQDTSQGTRYGTQGASVGTRYGSQDTPRGTRYGSQGTPQDISVATRYGSQDTSVGTRYGNQGTPQGRRDGTQGTPTGTRYGSQDTSQGTRYGNQGTPQDISVATRYGSQDTSVGTRYGNHGTPQGRRDGTQGTPTGTRYGSQDTSQGTRYGNQGTPQDISVATRYGSQDTSVGTRYGNHGTPQGRRDGTQGTRYGSQDIPQGTRYGGEGNSIGTRYSSQDSPQGTVYGNQGTPQETRYGSHDTSLGTRYGIQGIPQGTRYGSQDISQTRYGSQNTLTGSQGGQYDGRSDSSSRHQGTLPGRQQPGPGSRTPHSQSSSGQGSQGFPTTSHRSEFGPGPGRREPEMRRSQFEGHYSSNRSQHKQYWRQQQSTTGSQPFQFGNRDLTNRIQSTHPSPSFTGSQSSRKDASSGHIQFGPGRNQPQGSQSSIHRSQNTQYGTKHQSGSQDPSRPQSTFPGWQSGQGDSSTGFEGRHPSPPRSQGPPISSQFGKPQSFVGSIQAQHPPGSQGYNWVQTSRRRLDSLDTHRTGRNYIIGTSGGPEHTFGTSGNETQHGVQREGDLKPILVYQQHIPFNISETRSGNATEIKTNQEIPAYKIYYVKEDQINPQKGA